MTKEEMAHLDDMLEDVKDSQEASSPDRGSVGTPSVMSGEENFDDEKTIGTQTTLCMSRDPFLSAMSEIDNPKPK